MALSRNPCRYCIEAVERCGKYFPDPSRAICPCKNRRSYEEYRESQRMFIPGEPIASLEDLLKEDWVIWYGHTKHIEMFRSMSVRTVERFVKNHAFRKAIRKEI